MQKLVGAVVQRLLFDWGRMLARHRPLHEQRTPLHNRRIINALQGRDRQLSGSVPLSAGPHYAVVTTKELPNNASPTNNGISPQR
jgi:hypothetical protein